MKLFAYAKVAPNEEAPNAWVTLIRGCFGWVILFTVPFTLKTRPSVYLGFDNPSRLVVGVKFDFISYHNDVME